MAPCLRIHIEGSSRQYRQRRMPPNDHSYMRPATHMSLENISQQAEMKMIPNGIRPGTSARDFPAQPETTFLSSSQQENFNHPFLDTFERQFLRVLNKVYQTIERNEMRLCQQDAKDSLCLEWQEVALVLDRFLLLVFFIATVVFSASIIFNAPHARIR